MWTRDGFTMRFARMEDMEPYYEQNYRPLDLDIVYFTGSKEEFSKEEVTSFFKFCLEDEERFFFLITDPEGKIVGESVINEIDWKVKRGNFRIAIFDKKARDKGIGTWAVINTCEYAFKEAKLHKLDLEVFSFNPRAKRVYEKAGFVVEGILRDNVLNRGEYADSILMGMINPYENE